MLIIPAIDLRQGRCVRLLRGNFDAVTDYSGDPLAVAHSYKALGCRWLHIVDLDGARSGERQNAAVIGELVAASAMRVQVGGGIRSLEQARSLIDAGVQRVVIGSLAVTEPELVTSWLQQLGAERIVLAFDVRFDAAGSALLATDGWEMTTGVHLEDAMKRYLDHGLRHVLCTDISRDGAMSGPNEELYRGLCSRFPTLAIQASGGIRHAADLHALASTGASAAISGKAMLDDRMNAREIEPFLHDE